MYWAGVDIGGTKIAASIAADDAVILGTVRRATPPGADFSPCLKPPPPWSVSCSRRAAPR